MIRLLQQHLRGLAQSVIQLVRSPLPSLMSLTVIAMAMALPATLLLIAQGLQQATNSWGDSAQLSVFIKDSVDEAQALDVMARIERRSDVRRVEYLSPEAALSEFRQMSGLGESLEQLPENPLPATLLVEPSRGALDVAILEQLAETLRGMPEVEQVVVDSEWLRKLRAVLNVARSVGLALAFLMGIGVILVISNTVRLSVLGRQEEIEVTTLVGGTPAYVRRPFLYTGLLQGVIGGILGWAAARLTLSVLSSRIAELALLYSSDFRLPLPGWPEFWSMMAAAGLMGWLASRITVSWQLRRL